MFTLTLNKDDLRVLSLAMAQSLHFRTLQGHMEDLEDLRALDHKLVNQLESQINTEKPETLRRIKQ